MSNRVKVVICGEVITLKSSEEEAHLQRVARYIDQKMAELTATNATASINERIRTLLIAVNVADDYFKASDKLARLGAEQEKYINEIGRMQQENTLLREKFHALQAEHARLQAEHEEYVELFGSVKQAESANVLPLHRQDQRKVGLR